MLSHQPFDIAISLVQESRVNKRWSVSHSAVRRKEIHANEESSSSPSAKRRYIAELSAVFRGLALSLSLSLSLSPTPRTPRNSAAVVTGGGDRVRFAISFSSDRHRNQPPLSERTNLEAWSAVSQPQTHTHTHTTTVILKRERGESFRGCSSERPVADRSLFPFIADSLSLSEPRG